MLARLFRYGRLSFHGAYINLVTGRTVSIPIDVEAWKRLTAPNRHAPRTRVETNH
jgi:hypothetical protein